MINLPSLMKMFLLASTFFVLAPCQAQVKLSSSTNDNSLTRMPDEEAIKKAVDEAYKSLCFKQGETLNYDKIQNCFIPEAQFINFRSGKLGIFSLSQFIDNYKKAVTSGYIKSFYEEEIYGRTDQFGNIAQRISSYKTYMNNMDKVIERGVNSFQLVKTPNGWKVSSIVWDVEKSEQAIPTYYLNETAHNK
ncbi:hypothetical protein [Pedobacter sp. MW01-1-1]|uniref:hypothetical protein n=1 Tax=Pedobacter sp. MW01-1-1 TaxID=3383027 RepID=UPI003FF04665